MSFLDKFKKKKMAPKAKDEPKVSDAKKSEAPGATEEKQEKKSHDQAHEVMPLPAGSQAGGVLMHGVVSEKAAIGEAQGVYTFVVADGVNKLQVAQAVQALYGVRPTAVRMQNRDRKRVARGRLFGRTANTKRALVTLPKGKSMSVHEGV